MKTEERPTGAPTQEESPGGGLSSIEGTSGWSQRQRQCKTWGAVEVCPGHCGTINQTTPGRKGKYSMSFISVETAGRQLKAMHFRSDMSCRTLGIRCPMSQREDRGRVRMCNRPAVNESRTKLSVTAEERRGLEHWERC